MKKILLIVSALAFVLASCKGPEITPDDHSGKPDTSADPSSDTPAAKSNKCDVVSFTVLAGDAKVVADISPVEKKIVLPYYPEDADAMKSAKAEYTLSEGATISPDPATQALDYTREVKFTVTAEDGATTKEYTASSREYVVTLKVNRIWDDAFTYGQLKVTPYDYDQSEPMVAFAGPDKWVAPDLQVFGLDGNKLGVVDVTGIPSHWYPIGLANDADGVFVACFAYAADNKAAIDPYMEGGIFVWKDGYDKPPVKLWELLPGAETPQFPWNPYTADGRGCDYHELAVGGRVAGDFIVTTCHYPGWNESPEEGWFNVHIGQGGDIAAARYQVGKTVRTCSDANCWQQLIPVSGDPEGSFVICDSHPGTMSISVQEGLTPEFDTQLYGSLTDENNASGEAGAQGAFGYGNYTTGGACVFRFNGKDYVVAATSFWEGEYMTIQTLDETDPQHYLFETAIVAHRAQARPNVAAVYDPETDKVNIIYNVGTSFEFSRYEVSREVL